MSAFELVLHICLQASGTCYDKYIPVQPDSLSGSTCVIRAYELIEEWKNEHIGYEVKSWKCKGSRV